MSWQGEQILPPPLLPGRVILNPIPGRGLNMWLQLRASTTAQDTRSVSLSPRIAAVETACTAGAGQMVIGHGNGELHNIEGHHTAALTRGFWRCLRDCTCPQMLPSSFRRSGESNEYSPISMGPAVRTPEVKMLGQTGRHRPDSFFQRSTPEKIFEHKTFKAKAMLYLQSYTLRF